MAAPRKPSYRWWVWVLVPLAAMVGALSAFAEPAVRVTESKLGLQSSFDVSVRVWGLRLHRETVNVTKTNLSARSLALDRQWRWGLAAASGWVSGGAAAAVAAALFAGSTNRPQSDSVQLWQRSDQSSGKT